MKARICFSLLVALLCSCQPAPPSIPLVGTSGSRLWSGPAGGVPGLDSGHIRYMGNLLVIWAADASESGGGSTSGKDGVHGDGFLTLKNGRKVNYSFRLPDAKSGTLTLDGTEYDLANGRVFLVKPAGDKLEVKQIEKDFSTTEFNGADLAAIGRGESAIRTFFEPSTAK